MPAAPLSADRPGTRLATRLAFLVAGFGLACWAPLVPYARARVGVDDAGLGLLLLCLGIGSVCAMLAAGPLTARHGARPVVLASGIVLSLLLPLLAVAPGVATLGAVLFGFGAALGSLEVSMNVHAVEVERASGRPLMSGFHALFSIGGFAGATAMTALLSFGARPFHGTLIAAVTMLGAMLVAGPRLLRGGGGAGEPVLVWPRGIVLLLAVLAAVTFLVEGAMLDWGALLVSARHLAPETRGGIGYALFAVAMTLGRLSGDRLVARFGDRRILVVGGLVAVFGFVVLLGAPWAPLALAGFALIGLGASNLVPVLFRRAGSQQVMPTALAVGAITMLGYAGVLAGPALVGFVAQGTGLPVAFALLAVLMLAVPLAAPWVASPTRAGAPPLDPANGGPLEPIR